MATSHDKMRIKAAAKAYKAGEYKKALFHLSKVHDRDSVKGRIQQARAKLKEQQELQDAQNEEIKTKGKPAKFDPISFVLVVAIVIVIIGGMIGASSIQPGADTSIEENALSSEVESLSDQATPTPPRIVYPTSVPAPQQPAVRRPKNCTEAKAMGLSAVQAARWSHLDRDGDGVACYGD